MSDIFRHTDEDGDQMVLVRVGQGYIVHLGGGGTIRSGVDLPAQALRRLFDVLAVELDDDPRHVIEFRATGWTIKHPLVCRPALFDCPVNRAAEQELTEPPSVLGRFECGVNDSGDRLLIGDRIPTGPEAEAADAEAS